MPMQKSRLHRLMRIAALLKENRYPNSETLVKEFRRIAIEELGLMDPLSEFFITGE